MNIPFTGFQSALLVWGVLTVSIVMLVPRQLDIIAVVIISMFIGLLVAIGFHDMDAYSDDKWLKFREKTKNGWV